MSLSKDHVTHATDNHLINTFAERIVGILAGPGIDHHAIADTEARGLLLGDVIGAIRREASEERYQQDACLRPFLTISTAHLSHKAKQWLEAQAWTNTIQKPGAISHPVAAFQSGWMMWVPDAVDSDNGMMIHADLHDACVEASLCGASYLMFDADGEIIGSLPTYEDDETSDEGLTDEERAAMAVAGDAMDTPESIVADVSKDLADNEGLCPKCGGLGAFPETGMDCDECNGGGSVPKTIHPEDGMPMDGGNVYGGTEMTADQLAFHRRRNGMDEPDAYGGSIDEYLKTESDAFTLNTHGAEITPHDTYTVGGTVTINIKGIAKILHAAHVDQGLINIITGRLVYAAQRGVEMYGKRKAISEVKLAAADILTDIEDEVEQRMTGGNDETWSDLEGKRQRLAKAIAAL
jgi:hypothetical protein